MEAEQNDIIKLFSFFFLLSSVRRVIDALWNRFGDWIHAFHLKRQRKSFPINLLKFELESIMTEHSFLSNLVVCGEMQKIEQSFVESWKKNM